MIFIGDIHGEFARYKAIINQRPNSIQLGDMGVGFPGYDHSQLDIPEFHKFLRGNHDNPAVCREHLNYLGDYGFLPQHDIFYISGAWSIDRACRIAGVSWWEEEELSYQQLLEVIKEYKKIKPKIVATHDCPVSIMRTMFDIQPFPSRTGQAFDSMLEVYKPDFWVFAHHHVHRVNVKKIGKTTFICLGIGQTIEIK